MSSSESLSEQSEIEESDTKSSNAPEVILFCLCNIKTSPSLPKVMNHVQTGMSCHKSLIVTTPFPFLTCERSFEQDKCIDLKEVTIEENLIKARRSSPSQSSNSSIIVCQNRILYLKSPSSLSSYDSHTNVFGFILALIIEQPSKLLN